LPDCQIAPATLRTEALSNTAYRISVVAQLYRIVLPLYAKTIALTKNCQGIVRAIDLYWSAH